MRTVCSAYTCRCTAVWQPMCTCCLADKPTAWSYHLTDCEWFMLACSLMFYGWHNCISNVLRFTIQQNEVDIQYSITCLSVEVQAILIEFQCTFNDVASAAAAAEYRAASIVILPWQHAMIYSAPASDAWCLADTCKPSSNFPSDEQCAKWSASAGPLSRRLH